MEKSCGKCQIIKPLTEFHHSKKGKYGRRSWCAACMKIYQKKYERVRSTRRSTQARMRRQHRLEQEVVRWRDIDGHPSKKCTKCNQEYILDAFHSDSKSRDGLCRWCRVCANKAHHAYRQRADVKERYAETTRRWREDPANQNFGRIPAYRFEHRRRSAGLSLPDDTDRTITMLGLIELYGDKCLYCHSDFRMAKLNARYPTMDHIISINKSESTHTWSSVIPVCLSCNTSKRNRSLEDFVGEARATEIRELIADAQPRVDAARRFA